MRIFFVSILILIIDHGIRTKLLSEGSEKSLMQHLVMMLRWWARSTLLSTMKPLLMTISECQQQDEIWRPIIRSTRKNQLSIPLALVEIPIEYSRRITVLLQPNHQQGSPGGLTLYNNLSSVLQGYLSSIEVSGVPEGRCFWKAPRAYNIAS